MGDSPRTPDAARHPGDAPGPYGGNVVVETILRASRAMVTMAESSVHQVTADVTLPQYRTLVLVAANGRSRLLELARAMGVGPPTATRMCDRLVRKGLITRERDEDDRREIILELTDKGRAMVDAVTAQRRGMVANLLRSIPVPERAGLVRSLDLLTRVLNTANEDQWRAGWSPD